MKSLILLCTIMYFSLGATGQQYDVLFTEKKLSAESVRELKNSTTVFFLKKDTDSALAKFKTAVSSAWTMTPIVFDDLSNFDKYAGNPKYSYISIEVLRSDDRNYSTDFFLVLRRCKGAKRNGKPITEAVAANFLFPTIKTMGYGHFAAEAALRKVYEEGIFYNWDPIIIKAQLQVMQTNVTNGIRPHTADYFKDKNLSQLLSNDTLYVPKSILISYNAINGKQSEKTDNVFEGYKYPYRICTPEELYEIFEVQKRGRFLFEYVNRISVKYITVYDLRDSKIVYKRSTSFSHNLKDKDLEKID